MELASIESTGTCVFTLKLQWSVQVTWRHKRRGINMVLRGFLQLRVSQPWSSRTPRLSVFAYLAKMWTVWHRDGRE